MCHRVVTSCLCQRAAVLGRKQRCIGSQSKMYTTVILLSSFVFVCTRTLATNPASTTFCDKSLVSLLSDCSFMLGGGFNTCQIHHTNSCMAYDFTSWNMAPLQEITSLDALDYRISLTTYLYLYNLNYALSLNISLSASSADVHGFSYSMLEYNFPKEERYNTCRIFDFRKFHHVENVTLFYDCYFNIIGDNNNKFFLLTTRTLPTNHVADFYVTLSKSPLNVGGESVCNWESTVMILKQALPLRNVELLFSLAKRELMIQQYSISLIRHTTTQLEESVALIVQAATLSVNETMYQVVKIPAVRAGKYHIQIHPVHVDWSSHNCSVTATDTFSILPIENTSLTVTVTLSVICFIVLLAGLVMWIILRRTRPSARRTSRVFLLYSYDDAEHYAMVKAFYDFLCTIPGLDVIFDVAQANDMGVPHRWLLNNLTRVDHIILVISSGVYRKVEDDFRATREHHPWGDHVVPSVLHIMKDYTLHGRLVKVTFSNTADSKIPTVLLSKGTTFKLPRQLNRFVHHLFNESCLCHLHCVARHPAWYTSEREKVLVAAIQQRGNC
ncbi:uncharacterized protein LOC135385294 isoform X2 [Ornithodoros turicata]|uniref:uncharacterized protein LOC135385294 isoform X2 n=1 Tax=Ornithodoros turicata TaxID=34597 RepID=UPI003138C75B